MLNASQYTQVTITCIFLLVSIHYSYIYNVCEIHYTSTMCRCSLLLPLEWWNAGCHIHVHLWWNMDNEWMIWSTSGGVCTCSSLQSSASYCHWTLMDLLYSCSSNFFTTLLPIHTTCSSNAWRKFFHKKGSKLFFLCFFQYSFI